MRELRWNDVRGVFLRLPPEKQAEFIAYLHSLQDSEDNLGPQNAEILKEIQTTA